MPDAGSTTVAVVDCGLGNLFSVRNACARVGLHAETVSTADGLSRAAGVVLPGVGAFGDAMAALHRLDLVEPLKDAVAAGKPVLGICLGLQLLLTESYEFGVHRGLGVIDGTVEHFGVPRVNGASLKVPHVGWSPIEPAVRSWAGTLLNGVPAHTHMYFVHSYRVKPANAGLALSVSLYGDVEFCSTLQVGSLSGCQYHPERSADAGLTVYRNFGQMILGQGVHG